jgi:D-beta-D-heptose 7-phosphate kinase/D-beta-D-heptose 1-phosphate adenosyltransferase
MLIGFANGVFDLFHSGHKHFLMRCSQQCQYLIVAVNSDESVKRLKGDTRPVHTYAQRMHNIARYCDAVIPFDGYEEGLIVHIRPQVLFKGYDHHFDPTRGSAQVAKGIGCAIVQINELPGYSTTRILHETEPDAPTRP